MEKQGFTKETPILIQRLCYHTSLDHLTSKHAKHGNVYEHSGKAVVTNSDIYYRSDELNFDIPITSIVEMRIGTFYRYPKSAQLDYLAITYAVSGDQKTVLLVPTESTLTPQWKINKIIEVWYNTITQLKNQTYKKSDNSISVQKEEEDPGKQSIVSSGDIIDDWDFKTSSSEMFSLSKLFFLFRLLVLLTFIVLVFISVAFTIMQGELGFIVGILFMIIVIVSLYYYFYIQFQIRTYIHKNREKNILFKMWVELEEEPFLGPFKGNK